MATTLAPFMTPDGPATEPPKITSPSATEPETLPEETPPAGETPAGEGGSETPLEAQEDLSAPPQGLDVNSTRGQQIWADHRMLSQLEKPETEGGIGFKPNVDQIKGWAASDKSWANLKMDLQSGDPRAVGNVIQFISQLAPQSLPHIAGAISQINPELAQSLHNEAIGNEVQAILNLARQQSTQEGRDYWFQVANGLHYASNGKTLDPAELTKPYQPPSSKNPAANSLEERERRVAEQEQLQARRVVDGWYQSLMTERDQVMNAVIEPILKKSNLSPEIQALVGKELRQKVINSINDNSYLRDSQDLEIRRASTSGGDPRILQTCRERLLSLYQTQVHPVIEREARTLIRRSQPAAVAAARAADAKLSSAKGDTAPAGPPVPANPASASVGLPGRSKGETDQDYIFRVMGGILQQ